MGKAACKEIIDNGGRISSESLGLAALTQTQQTSLSTFGVKESSEGEKWLKASKAFQSKAIKTLSELKDEAAKLCMSQPIE